MKQAKKFAALLLAVPAFLFLLFAAMDNVAFRAVPRVDLSGTGEDVERKVVHVRRTFFSASSAYRFYRVHAFSLLFGLGLYL